MAKVSYYRNYTKVAARPRRPFEKERLSAELKLIGQYGLKNKKEIYRVNLVLSKIRKAARILLTLPKKDPRRIFQGNALLDRMLTYGFLHEHKQQLDYVLSLNLRDFLDRRLQTLVHSMGLAKSMHHARVLIRQRHIRVGNRMVNVPSFMVRTHIQSKIDFSPLSPFGGGRPGRIKRKNIAKLGEPEE